MPDSTQPPRGSIGERLKLALDIRAAAEDLYQKGCGHVMEIIEIEKVMLQHVDGGLILRDIYDCDKCDLCEDHHE